jgi:hypothetical protein
MNSLTQLIARLNLDETRVMNALQGETNLISDNCVTAADVAGLNCFRACEWVIEQQARLR